MENHHDFNTDFGKRCLLGHSARRVPTHHLSAFDSDRGWCDVSVDGFLVEAMRASGMRQPRRAQFQSQGQWIDVSQFALQKAIKQAQELAA
jgi:hypothetical protein